MPVTITPHLEFEALLEGLLRELDLLPKGVKPHPVVIPSIPFSDHLQLAIARKRGICMGLEFLTPSGFINRVTGRKKNSPWSGEHLVWRILPLAKSLASKIGIDSSDPSVRDLFATSGLLADRLDQYGHFRPEMIRAWNEGANHLGQAAENDESWQKALWTTLKSSIGEPHPAVTWKQLSGDSPAMAEIVKLFPKLTVIGTGSIDPMMIEILGALEQAGSEISTHLLLPTGEYMGDLRNNHGGNLTAARENPDSFASPESHPLLCSMGRHAVGSFLLLGKLDENYSGWPESRGYVPGTGSSSLLGDLQSDIHSLQGPSPSANSHDGSISIHSCFGPRREMEVLRDEILRAFAELDDLKPHEIHIVTPSLDVYGPLVAAVLEQISHQTPSLEIPLKVRLTETPRSGQNPMTVALLSLLEMAMSGAHEASWIMELLHLEPVRKALLIGDDERGLDRVRGWIRESGLTRGFTEDPSSPSPGSWDFARERLIAGSWMGDLQQARYTPGGSHVLPVTDQLAGEGELLERFLAWHVRLQEILGEWKTEASPASWGDRLVTAAKDLLGCNDGEDLKVRPHLNFLKEVSCETPVDAGTMLDWLDKATGDERRRSPHSGKITFGRFKQLQNLPCRVLCMVGMQDGAFPGQSRIPAWDLLQAKPRMWDRNPRTDDRQLFLDALLTPTDRLVITGSTRNIRTNKEEPFSTCVDELLRVLESMGASRGKLTFRHRLQPYSEKYFSENPDDDNTLPRSFSKTQAAVARGIREAEGERAPQPFHIKRDPEEGEQADAPPLEMEITLKELVDFWKDPAKAYVKAQGIALWRDEEDDEALDHAPVSLNTLESWKIRDAILREQAFADQPDLDLVEARLRADRMLPAGELGTKVWESHLQRALPLGQELAGLGLVKKPLACTVMFAAADGMPEIHVKVTGEVLLNEVEGTASPALVFFSAGTFDKAKNHLEPFIHSVFSAHCDRLPQTLVARLFDEDHVYKPKELPPMMPPESPDPLRDGSRWWFITEALVRGYLIGRKRPLCYAPETTDAYLKGVEGTSKTPALPPAEALLKAKASAWEGETRLHGSGEKIPNEGSTLPARIAWRDLDPFAAPEGSADWERWANDIAEHLRAWSKPV